MLKILHHYRWEKQTRVDAEDIQRPGAYEGQGRRFKTTSLECIENNLGTEFEVYKFKEQGIFETKGSRNKKGSCFLEKAIKA